MFPLGLALNPRKAMAEVAQVDKFVRTSSWRVCLIVPIGAANDFGWVWLKIRKQMSHLNIIQLCVVCHPTDRQILAARLNLETQSSRLELLAGANPALIIRSWLLSGAIYQLSSRFSPLKPHERKRVRRLNLLIGFAVSCWHANSSFWDEFAN